METILVIEDNEMMRATLRIFLSELNCRLVFAENGERGLELLENEYPDLVITDLMMPGINGIEVLEKVKKFDRNIQILIVTAFEDFQSTIKAMQMGAYDYIKKPLELDQFITTVKRALECRVLSERVAIAISEDSNDFRIDNSIIGNHPSMHELYKKVGKVSVNRVNILIQGESGTGKELITKVIHYSGVTKDSPFVAVNCSALSESLLESELFGHVKGAFTGAIKDKKGKFELAGDGTIFLDEISEISPNLQVKLLRVLQEKEFEKVGGETTIPMRARVVAATNKNLSELVSKGLFRSDLFYRLQVFTIDVPPLRERKDDIPNLVVHFLMKINKELHKNISKVPYNVMEMLSNYEWVGNVRELENTLLQAVVLAKGDVLEKEYILLQNTPQRTPSEYYGKANLSLAEIEKEHIKLVLDSVKWNKEKACRILGITRPTLNARIEQYALTYVCNSQYVA
ncbi:MAG: sigma-54-dependent Fis family transcriptional regulator [Ignavibacteria bacterium]|jgi:two-component system response regulator AtoC|nr:sigma-54-dependent Fis family transcriptional regulator [Ignavibacteria bacterium]MCU7502369.1 sigma-54-dependent Fis family transcriptional regulator [Ignavibacteria bacterium]MCU7515066.1 sigma-54-dependent Fis family transcriptional regulator [Ignavibacteria bacterium]